MIVLGEIELRGVDDLGRDGAEALRRQGPLVGLLRLLRCRPLGRRGDVDAGAILGADIVALAHPLRGIVALPEGLQQTLIGNLGGVEDDQHHFVVAGAAGADFLVAGVGREAARVSDRGDMDAVAELPELALGTPEASEPEHGGLKTVRIGPLQGASIDEMMGGGAQGLAAAGQRRCGRGHVQVFAERKHRGSPWRRLGAQYRKPRRRPHRRTIRHGPVPGAAWITKPRSALSLSRARSRSAASFFVRAGSGWRRGRRTPTRSVPSRRR